jgi:hypothetical protein
MTPQEKADELIRKYYRNSDLIDEDLTWIQAKLCVLVAVDEIIKFMEMDDEHNECLYFANSKWVQYWLEVKKEIEKL